MHNIKFNSMFLSKNIQNANEGKMNILASIFLNDFVSIGAITQLGSILVGIFLPYTHPLDFSLAPSIM